MEAADRAGVDAGPDNGGRGRHKRGQGSGRGRRCMAGAMGGSQRGVGRDKRQSALHKRRADRHEPDRRRDRRGGHDKGRGGGRQQRAGVGHGVLADDELRNLRRADKKELSGRGRAAGRRRVQQKRAADVPGGRVGHVDARANAYIRQKLDPICAHVLRRRAAGADGGQYDEISAIGRRRHEPGRGV